MKKLIVLMIPALLFFSGCEDDPKTIEVKSPIELNAETTTWDFRNKNPDQSEDEFHGSIIGTEKMGGITLHKYKVGIFDSEKSTGIETTLKWEKDRITFGKAEIFHSDLTGDTTKPITVIQMDEPLEIDLDTPVGVEQKVQLKGTLPNGFYPLTDQPITLDQEGTYTVVETDTSVETAAGVIKGCSKIEVSVTITTLEIKSTVYYHPTFGLAAVTLNWPADGLNMDLVGVKDKGTIEDGYRLLSAVGTVGPTRTFSLSTLDATGQNDADKNTHAKMYVEMRWKDEILAKSNTQPPVNLSFTVPFGYFPYILLPSDTSLLHPEQNGHGYKFWIGFVDQASKNNVIEGPIYYMIDAMTSDYNASDVMISAKLLYKVIQ